MAKSPTSSYMCYLVLLLAAVGPALAGTTAAAASGLLPVAPSPLKADIGRDLSASADGDAVESVYRNRVRSDEDAATFFYSAAFLRLGLADQRQVIDTALALDPAGFLARSEFLPLALRAEYRAKSRTVAGDLQLCGLAPAARPAP